MKRLILASVAAGAATLLGGCATAGYANGYAAGSGGGVAVGGAVSVGGFHEALAPHGEWVTVGAYGNVWRPSVAEVGPGFRPYATGGRWVYSDVGWSWTSDYDWGWAPFHYGRWILDPVYGWVWIPDTVWGPAWVTWRYGGGFVGWAPLGPPGFIDVESSYPYWCFVGHGYLLEPNVYHYAAGVDYHQAFAVTSQVQGTVMVNGTTRVWAGPPVGNISAATGRNITPVHIGAPAAGVVAPHTINGVSAPQIAHSGGVIPGAGVQSRPTFGTGFNGQAINGPRTGTVPGAGVGQLHTPPNNPTTPQNPAYRGPASTPYGYGAQPGQRPAQSYGYGGYGSVPAQRSSAAPAYRPGTGATYRPAAPAATSRPSAPASSAHPRTH